MKQKLLTFDLACGQMRDILATPVGSTVRVRFKVRNGKIYCKQLKVLKQTQEMLV